MTSGESQKRGSLLQHEQEPNALGRLADAARPRRRRMILAYEETPTTIARMIPRVDMREQEPTRWCAACADGKRFDETLIRFKPLYRTGKLPGRCVQCGIELRHLAAL